MKKLTLLLMVFCWKSILTSYAENPPNILLIITDDQRVDTNVAYNKRKTGVNESPLGYAYSPNIDQLADEGTSFLNVYCNSPACAPSRASIITGKYPHHNGIYGFEQTHDETDFFNLTMPQVLKEQGYHTSIIGKSGYYIFDWRNGLSWKTLGLYDDELDFKNDLKKHGFTDYYANAIYENIEGKTVNIGSRQEYYYPDGSHKFFYNSRKVGELTEEDLRLRAEVEKEQDLLYAYTRENAEMVIGGVSTMPKDSTIDAFILKEFENYLIHENQSYKTLAGEQRTGANTSEPQFINLGFHLPHTPVLPPKEFRDMFKDKVYKIPAFDDDEYAKFPEQLKVLYGKLKIDGLKYEEKQQAIRDYYAFCAFGDYLVGKAIQSFKDYSIRNGQEYVILYVCGDHGWHLGEQGIEAKFGPWDQSNHNSIIAVSSDPDIFPKGKTFSGFAEFVDIMPTVLAATGVDTKASKYDYLDGVPLQELQATAHGQKEYVLGEINHVAGPRAFLRSKDFAFSMKTRQKWGKPGKAYAPNADVRWALEVDRAKVDMAFYDLRIDPLERNNVANDPDYLELVDWFRQKLGNIVLGDGRVECDWSQQNVYGISDFAKGADDKQLDIPVGVIPKVEIVSIEEERVVLEQQAVYTLNWTLSDPNAAFIFSSNNTEVATVDQSGKVTMVGKGTAGISVKLENGVSDICVVMSKKDEEIPLEINVKKKDKRVLIFPNPSTGTFQILNASSHILSVNIYTEEGKCIKTLTSDLEIPIGGALQQGVYLIEITTEKEVFRERFIKQ